MITSNSNQQIKNISALLKSAKERKKQGMFVIEGQRIIADSLKYVPELVDTVYMSESYAGTIPDGVRTETVSDSVFAHMCDTVTPQGILAVVKMPCSSYEDVVHADGPVKLLVLENIQDPGNLGTMLRTAEAAGMTGIIMSRDTVDIFSPKVTRATMGSIFRVPFVYTADMGETVRRLQKDGIRVYATYLHGGRPYRESGYADRAAVLIGNEGSGLKAETAEAADERIFIPMEGQIESLNASVAAALMMFELKCDR